MWPKLLRVSEQKLKMVEDLEDVHKFVDNEVYQQILKDVARSGSHMPEDTSEDAMEKFQKELTQIICWVLSKHSELKYVRSLFLICTHCLLSFINKRIINFVVITKDIMM